MIDAAAILDALPVALYLTDSEGHLTYYNDAAAELWGWRPPLGQLWCGSYRIYDVNGSLLPHEECPMAVALKEGRPVRGARAVAERPDGTRIPFMPFPTPLRDESGQIIGALNLLVDLTERSTMESRLAAIVTFSDDAIVSKTLEGVVTSWNTGAQRIFGYTPEEMIGQPITTLIPPDLQHQETEILARLRKGERIDHFETVRVAKDGRLVEVSLTVSPIHDQSGRVIGASKIARDITERKEAERIQRLLVDELNHRVKNTLATVQAIGRQSLAHARSQHEFVDSFTHRIQALARAHSLLTESNMQGASVSDIVVEQALIGPAVDRRVSYAGPVLDLDPQRSIHLGMMLHELSSNARRHGALSTPDGRIDIKWEVRTAAGRTLILTWEETGGPVVPKPNDTGFGTKLIEQTARSYGGDARINYRAEGIICRIELPLADVERMAIDRRKNLQSDGSLLAGLRADRSSVLRGKRFLVVEDEPMVAIDIRACLTRAGCEVLGPAGTAPEAQLLIEQRNFDAALLDLNLEGNSSEELAQELTRRNIPFAFVTGYRRSALPPAFRDSIMLAKPFESEQLISIAEALVYLPKAGNGVIPLRRRGSGAGA